MSPLAGENQRGLCALFVGRAIFPCVLCVCAVCIGTKDSERQIRVGEMIGVHPVGDLFAPSEQE